MHSSVERRILMRVLNIFLRIFLLVSALALNINILLAQDEIKISGSVADDSTMEAVPFVNVSHKGTATFTDINGKFGLVISVSTGSDSVLFSRIGYENKIIPIRSFLALPEQTIALTQKVYELHGPTIHGLNSKQIVEKAIRKIPGVVAADTFYQQGFYRQYHEENNTFVRLIEAEVIIENRIEKNKTSLKGKERVSITRLRRSDNYEQNKEAHGDHLIDLLEENPVYHSEGTMLNLKAVNLYKFYLDTTAADDSVYHIFYYSTDRTRDRYDRGEIFIDAADFTILKITKEEFSNPNSVRRQPYNSKAPYRWEFLSSKLVAEYKMKNKKMYPASLVKTYTHELYDNKVHTKEFLVKECFELTFKNEILRGQLPQKANFSVFSELYNRKYAYDSSSWKNDSIPGFYFQKSEDVKHDLEKNKNLEEQFLQNSTSALIYDLIEKNRPKFSLTDTSFKEGLILRRYFIWGLDKAEVRNESVPTLDSIADFLFKNKNLAISVDNHAGYLNSTHYCTNITRKRAEAIVYYLVSKGIKQERLAAKGYGHTRPLIRESTIQKLKTKEEQEKARQINRRTEITIVQTDYKEN